MTRMNVRFESAAVLLITAVCVGCQPLDPGEEELAATTDTALAGRYRFRVLDWNIAGKADAFALLENQIEKFDPDVVLLQEVCSAQKTAWAERHPGWEVHFAQMTSAHPGCGDTPKGLMLASPRPMKDVFEFDLGQRYFDEGLNQWKRYKLLCGKVSTPQGRVKACTTHLRVGDPGAEAARLVLTRHLVAKLLPAALPIVVGGDFNAKPTSDEMAILYERFNEADRGDDASTHGQKKIDYIFFDKKHSRANATSGGVISQDVSDHDLYRGWAELTF